MVHLLLLAASTEEAKYLDIFSALPSQIPGLTLSIVLDVPSRPDAELAALGATAEGIVMWVISRPSLQKMLPLCPKLRWVHSHFAGIDWILYPEFAQRDEITLTLARGIYSNSLAEWVMTGVLYFEKKIPRLISNKARGVFDKFLVSETRGKTMGVIGYGDIGRACGSLAKAFGLKVLALRNNSAPGDEEQGIYSGVDGLHKMLPLCDFVAITAPLTSKTRGMISEKEFALMKDGAVLINIGRGAVVDEAAMIKALKSGKLTGAALDVFAVEPLPAGHELYSIENVLLSPHCADNTYTWKMDSAKLASENIRRFVMGEPLMFVADKRAGY